MTAVFAFLLNTKLGRTIDMALLAVLLVSGIYLYGRHVGKQAGHVDGAKEQLEVDRKQMDSDRTAFQSKMGELNSESAAKDAVINKQTQLISVYDAKLLLLNQQSVAQQAAIARMTDPQVLLDLAQRLGVRSPADQTPSLYPGEIRKADSVVADCSLQGQKLDEVTKKVDAQATELQAMRDKQGIADEKLAAALDYINTADTRFKNAYNVFYKLHHPPTILKIVSFGLVHDRQIPDIKPIEPLAKPAALK